jgi:hypothetical protein
MGCRLLTFYLHITPFNVLLLRRFGCALCISGARSLGAGSDCNKQTSCKNYYEPFHIFYFKSNLVCVKVKS